MKNFLLGVIAALLVAVCLGAAGGSPVVTIDGKPVFELHFISPLHAYCEDNGKCWIDSFPPQPPPAQK